MYVVEQELGIQAAERSFIFESDQRAAAPGKKPSEKFGAQRYAPDGRIDNYCDALAAKKEGQKPPWFPF